jgi:glycine cleavage system aminomethyltransferase T
LTEYLRSSNVIRKTTSAAFGFHVGKPVALAYLNGATGGDRLRIDIAPTMFPTAFNPTGTLMQPAQQ